MERSIIVSQICFYASSRPIEILTNFLTDDVGSRSLDSINEWINNDTYNHAILNYSYLKKNNNKISIYFFYDGYEKKEDPSRIKFETTKEQLLEILEKWEQIYKERYIYTSLFIDKDNIQFKGKNFD